MKPVFLKVLNSQETSIDIRHEIVPYFKNPWHFHPEFELTFIIESSGTHFVGSTIRHYYKNDITFTGPNLPHYWRCDPEYYQEGHPQKAEAIILRFHTNFLGKDFFLLPEMQLINNLFKISRQGLRIVGPTKEFIGATMVQMMKMDYAERIFALLNILHTLAKTADYKLLSTVGYIPNYGSADAERINAVYTYLVEHFMKPVHLNKVASVANMNAAAFCRYFKVKTGKTFVRFLNEIRIAHSCKILMEGRYNVSQVCYECGFQNQSYFIKQFKKITGQTPLSYQKQYDNA